MGREGIDRFVEHWKEEWAANKESKDMRKRKGSDVEGKGKEGEHNVR